MSAVRKGLEFHVWFNPHRNGYPRLGDYESCRKCGVVKNERNAEAKTCRGIVRVGLRAGAVTPRLTRGPLRAPDSDSLASSGDA